MAKRGSNHDPIANANPNPMSFLKFKFSISLPGSGLCPQKFKNKCLMHGKNSTN